MMVAVQVRKVVGTEIIVEEDNIPNRGSHGCGNSREFQKMF